MWELIGNKGKVGIRIITQLMDIIYIGFLQSIDDFLFLLDFY